jgi:hypothetical protein
MYIGTVRWRLQSLTIVGYENKFFQKKLVFLLLAMAFAKQLFTSHATAIKCCVLAVEL